MHMCYLVIYRCYFELLEVYTIMELSYLQNVFLDLISYFIDLLTLELFISAFFPYKHPKQYSYIRICTFCIYLFMALNPTIPFSSFLFWIIKFTYMLLISSFHWKQSLLFFFKYELFYNILYLICTFITTIINVSILDTSLLRNNMYFYYQSLIDTSFAYIVLNLFLYHKQLKRINKKSHLSINFSIYAVFSILFLLFSQPYIA